MKDIKTYIIGFLSCACLFLIMGHSEIKNVELFESISCGVIYPTDIIIGGTDEPTLVVSNQWVINCEEVSDGTNCTTLNADGLLIEKYNKDGDLVEMKKITIND